MIASQNLAFAIALVCLLLLSAFFSASETALMSINRYRLRHRIRQGHRSALKVLELLKMPDRLLGMVLIGNTIANIVASSLATILASRLYGNMGVAVATGILTFMVLIFSEIAPKTIAATYSEPIAFVVVWPLTFLLKTFYPIVWLLNTCTNRCLQVIGLKSASLHAGDRLTSEELSTVVSESADSIPSQHKEMLLSILDLEKRRVEDVMLPRHQIVGIDLEQPISVMIKKILQCRELRLPVYAGSIDRLLGVLPMNQAVRLLASNQVTPKNLQRVMEPAYFIPEATLLSAQLHQFKVLHRSSAFVVDEYGDIQGLVTLEDIVEEIVGSMEAEAHVTHEPCVKEAENCYMISGSALVREVNKMLAWQLPEYGPKTLSGLVLEYLETIPEGPVCVTIGNYQVEVLQTAGSQIQSLRVRYHPPAV